MTPLAVVCDARRLEPQTLDVRRAAGGDQDLVGHELAAPRAPRPARSKRSSLSRPSRPRDRTSTSLTPSSSWTPSRSSASCTIVGGVGVLAGEELGPDVEDGDVGAEAREGLGQLAADRAAADDRQAAGQLGQVEDGLVGEVADSARGPGPAAPRRGPPVAITRPPEAQALAVDLDGVGGDEARARRGRRRRPGRGSAARCRLSTMSARSLRMRSMAAAKSPLADRAGRREALCALLHGVPGAGRADARPSRGRSRRSGSRRPSGGARSSATRAPSPAAPAAATSPAVPAPITTRW